MNELSLSLSLSSLTPRSVCVAAAERGSLPFCQLFPAVSPPPPVGGSRDDPVALQAHPFPIHAHGVAFQTARRLTMPTFPRNVHPATSEAFTSSFRTSPTRALERTLKSSVLFNETQNGIKTPYQT